VPLLRAPVSAGHDVMPVAQAVRLWQLLGDHLTQDEKAGEAQF
jgi:hypothetical protein